MIITQTIGNIGELPGSVIKVKIQTGKIADDNEVQIPIMIQIDKGGTIGPAIPLFG